MHRRYQHINIPTEIVRAIVVIAETGSFSKAADRLGLSQPAISAQVKRLQTLAGGSIFQRTLGGLEFTPLGNLVLSQARKLLEANDQILSLGGSAENRPAVRVGITTFYAEQFLEIWKGTEFDTPLYFLSDRSHNLLKGLNEGFIDVACVADQPDATSLTVQWVEQMAWARSSDFVLSPGAPLPLVTWPGSMLDMPIISLLDRVGMAYRVVFASEDFHARQAAVAAGLGLMGLPLRLIKPPLIPAREYYLPEMTDLNGGIAIRPGFDHDQLPRLLDILGQLAPEAGQQMQAKKRKAG